MNLRPALLNRDRASALAVGAAFALLAALFWLGGHREWQPSRSLVAVEPRLVSGDEPHYLLVIDSLLRDGDLLLQDDYRRVWMGSAEAGRAMQGRALDHHTFLVDLQTGESARWFDAYDRSRPLSCPPQSCSGFALRLRQFSPRPSVVEVPAHPVAFPALLALLLAPLRVRDLEAAALDLCAALALLACAATFLAGRRAGLSRASASCAALLAGAASPFLSYGRSLFAETTIGLALALGLWALQSRRPALAGLAASAAMAMKPPFALVGLAWAVERLWARRPREALALLAVCAVCGAALLGFNQHLAHTPVIAGTNAWKSASGPGALAATLFDPRHGVVLFVPWLLVPVCALRLPRPGPPAGAPEALLRQIALCLGLHLLLLAAEGNGPGHCYGPRYWVALLPLCALAAVSVARGRVARAALLALALAGAAIAIPAVLRYRTSFGEPPFAALAGG